MRKQAEELMMETNHDLNYKRLRARIAEAKFPLIPFPGADPALVCVSVTWDG